MREDHPVKAYKNLDFLNSPSARTLRILAEYEEPRQRFQEYDIRDTIVFFGSARAKSPEQIAKEASQGKTYKPRTLDTYYELSRKLASKITEWSLKTFPKKEQYVITTGAGPGIMEAANRGAHEAGGLSVGLGISLPFEEDLNIYVPKSLSFEFHYFFMRKYWFMYLAKALVAFPGGFGTLDEVIEALTLVQTGKIHKKLPIVLFGQQYWESVLHIEELLDWETISEKDRSLFHISDSVDDAFDFLVSELKDRSFPQP